MKLFIVILAVLLLCGLSMAGATPAPQKDCNQKACPTDYNPLCGEENGKHITFGNPCVLGVHNCEKNATFVKVSDGECPDHAPVRML